MTPFPATPRDVAALTLQEFTFRLDLDHSPSLPDVCDRFGEDTNRAVVWLVRFRALQKIIFGYPHPDDHRDKVIFLKDGVRQERVVDSAVRKVIV